jgi:riboflavin kinase / FMN adenylyltransferase
LYELINSGLKIYHSIQEISKAKIANPVVTIGTYDGLHKGHRFILDFLTNKSKEINGESVLVTFDPHPRKVLFPEVDLSLVQTMDEKIQNFKDLGLQHLFIVDFTIDFSRVSAEIFVRDYLVKAISINTLVIGHDHQFGKNREGSFEHLNELSSVYGFDLTQLPVKKVNDLGVSSTKIRKAVANGEMELANSLLGSLFEINGIVESGDKIGTELGFPTANINIQNQNKLLPKNGVYFGHVTVDNKTYFGMINLGYRPTINGQTFKIEVNILDFNMDIYNKKIKFQFIKHVRDEIKFKSKNDLIKQIKKDEANCRIYFTQH